MSSRDSARSVNKERFERRMVKQREKDYDHQQKWNGQVQYYKTWEKSNNKFQEWTSPRYYETNTQKFQAIKKAEERKDLLVKRREKLRQLFAEEEKSFNIELMVRKNRTRTPQHQIPTEVLKDVQSSLKAKEEERRRYEAEIALYHQWRNNNPIVREHERSLEKKNVKLAWLDQQIEKKREQERSEEECRRILAERNRRLEEDKLQEEQLKKEIAERNDQLKSDLVNQITELKLAQERGDELQKKEEEAQRNLNRLFELENEFKEEQKRQISRQIDLENLRYHKLKLKRKAAAVQESLEYEKNLMRKLMESEAADKMEDEKKRIEIKRSMDAYFKFVQDQKDLEVKREKYFDFVFDSEAKLVCDRQEELWSREEDARKALFKEVLDTIKDQVREKIERSRDEQREAVKERESIMKVIEDNDQTIQKNNEEQKRKVDQWKKDVEEQIKEKLAREKQEKLSEQKKLDLELEQARKEEERIKREIIELQRKQGPIKHTRSRVLF